MSQHQSTAQSARGCACRTGRLDGAGWVLSPGLILLWITGCGAVVPDELAGVVGLEPSATTESHGDFQTFEYTCTPGLAFVAQANAVSHATIARDPAGGYWLEMSVWAGSGDDDSRITWEEWDTWEAWDTIWTWADPEEWDLPGRALNADEVRRVRSVFATIPVQRGYIDSMIDYEFIEEVRWDARGLSANPTHGVAETIAYTKVEEIVRMLEDFGAAHRP